MESKEQVERIKEILPNCTEREIYEALDYCKMDSDAAAERLLSRVETEKNRGTVPLEGEVKVERIKKMMPRFAEEMIREVLKQCDMDSSLAIQRLLSQETGKNRERSPMGRKEQFECIKDLVPCLTEDDREGVPMEWKEQVERIKEMTPRFTKEMIFKMLEQCYIDSDLTLSGLLSPGSPLNDFSSPPSSAKSSVASQLHIVSSDKGKEAVRHTEADAATTPINNVLALRVKGPWSSHPLQPASDTMALGNDVALGSSEFLEYELFPPPTQQCGIQLMLNDLVANADRPSELLRLLGLPFLETQSVPSRSSAAGSQHLQTSAPEGGPSEATPSNSATSHIQPFRDPQDPVLDALLACSRYGPIQRPMGISENAHPFTSSASVLRSPETLSLGNNMSAGHGFTRPYAEPSSYEPQWPLQQYGYKDNMHQNFGYDVSSAQQEAHQGGSSSWANADASDIPHGSRTISHAPSDISRTGHDFALHAQDQHQLGHDYHHAEMNSDDAGWNHQPDSGAISALPKLQLGSFPGWAPLPAKASNQHGERSSPQYAYRGCQAGNFLKRAKPLAAAHMIWPREI